MLGRKVGNPAGTKSRRLRQAVERQTENIALAPLRDPLAQVTSRISNDASASAHASVLNRATAERPTRAGQYLLWLQRQYGNRYVQRMLTSAGKSGGDAKATVESEHIVQRADNGQQQAERGVTARGRDHYVLWNFASGGTQLRPEHEAQLSAIIDQVGILRLGAIQTKVRLDGHSSRGGSRAASERFSIQRVGAVFRYLYDHGLAPERMELHFHGWRRPWFPNATNRGRARNRRVEVRIVRVAQRPARRRRLHGWNINYGPNFRRREGGYALNSTLLARVTSLCVYLLSRRIVRGRILFRQGVRSRATAHLWSTAHYIRQGSVPLANLRALPNGRDRDGNLWYQPTWSWADIVANARGHWSGRQAAEGYPRNDPRRRPNTNVPGVSRHVYGLAMDVTIPWPYNPWDRRARRLIRRFGLRRPVSSECWHFQLR